MPYLIDMSGGTVMEFHYDSMGNKNYSFSPHNVDDRTFAGSDVFIYVKPYGGVSTPPPILLQYTFNVSELPVNQQNWQFCSQKQWGSNNFWIMEWCAYWYQGERWGFPSHAVRWRLVNDRGETVQTYNLLSSAGGATSGYISFIIGATPYEAVKVGEALYWQMSYRIAWADGYFNTHSAAAEKALEEYNRTEPAGYVGIFPSAYVQVAAHSVFSDAWLKSQGDFNPDYTGRGYYGGAIDGGRVPHEFIRRGIDYLRTLDIYDETYSTHGNNAAFLKNKVGEVDYNGVEFSYPFIKVRVNTTLQFTHAVTASWSQNNRPVVYEVVEYHELGNNLAEYTLKVDGLKTYFQYHTNTNPFVLRHTNSANWNKWVKDTIPYKGTYEYMKLTGTTMSVLYIVVLNGNDVYGLTEGEFNQFRNKILNSDLQSKIIPQISACYMLPINQSAKSGISGNSSNMDFVGVTDFQFAPSYHCSSFGTTTISINGSDALHNISDQSFLYDSHATIHCAGYGDVNAPVDFIRGLVDGARSIQYRFSFIDGTVAVSTYPYICWSPTVSLPQISIPYNSEAVQLYNVNRNQQAGISTMLTSAASGALTGLVAGGGVGAIVGGAVGAGASYLNLNRGADAQRDIIANTQGLSGASCTGAASFADMQCYISFIVPELAVSYPEYYKVVGYPVQRKLNDCLTNSGDTFWCMFNRAELSDKKEIIDDLVAKGAEGIYWNP